MLKNPLIFIDLGMAAIRRGSVEALTGYGWSEMMAIPERRRAKFADVGAFVGELYGVDLHAKRVESLAGATLLRDSADGRSATRPDGRLNWPKVGSSRG